MIEREGGISFLKKGSKKPSLFASGMQSKRAKSVLPVSAKSLLIIFFKKEHFAVLLLQWIGQAHAQSLGERLYRGAALLTGSIAGQTTAMPASVLARTNCHVGSTGNSGGDAQAAPDLRGGCLSVVRSRRNGPAARYTQATFCRTLRTGVDPVYMILPVQMPRFTISDTDCAALWTYLDAKP